ncbi:MAG: hypothetical protein ACXVXP_06855 [Mycobacteriaceae bacterium]
MPARSDLVPAYWRHHELASGDRKERLASEEHFWAWEAVEEAMEGDDPLVLLDSLLEAPGADPCYLGAGPIEDLLVADPDRWGEAFADRCRTSPRWREAMACVFVQDRNSLKNLAVYLKPFG